MRHGRMRRIGRPDDARFEARFGARFGARFRRALTLEERAMKTTIIAAVLVALATPAPALHATDTGHQKLTGVYRTYSGALGDSGPPTPADTKVMFSIDGKAAREMFDAMGKDIKDACTDDSATRVRMKDHGRVVCSRGRQGDYACHFGFDLKSGKSIGGSVC
jgi:hypothetical protein